MRPRLPLPLVLLALSALGATCKGKAPTPEGAQEPEPAEDAPLVRAPAVTELEGVELGRVPPSFRGDALRILNETFSHCGCARTVASCLGNRASCSCPESSERVAEFVIDTYEKGATTAEVESLLLEAFSEAYNARPIELDLAGQPSLGQDDAAHTIVEFADFRCPHCRDAFGELVNFVKDRPDVRLVYYYFPLSGFGEVSIRAAKAAEAARRQGKFWMMAALLYRNQLELERDDVLDYARQAGLDMARFEADLEDDAVQQAVMADKSIGQGAGVEGTPAIFVDGRPLGLAHDAENLALRLAMEEDRALCD